jgi:uncharacterized 2Fe-2S/4Fe-4S cluster protein (DUF4445 family)
LRSCSVRFIPDGKKIVVIEGTSILDAAIKAKVDISSICGGRGYCGKCQVIITDEQQSIVAISTDESNQLGQEKIALGYRIACKAKINNDTTIKIPEESRTGKQKLVIMGTEPEINFNPPTRKYYIEPAKPTIHDRISDDLRVIKALKGKGVEISRLDFSLALKLPELCRKSDWRITAVVRFDGELIDIEAGDTTSENYGFAVDIGTTKVAGFMVDLNTGTLLRAEGIMNPQIPFGEDLMTRIAQMVRKPENMKKLHEVTIEGINDLLTKTCGIINIDPKKITEMAIAGNTAMHHFFLGAPLNYVAMAPYPPAIAKSMDIKAEMLGISIKNSGYVHLLPNVAGFIGADAIADVLATEIYKQKDLSLLIDVGTNTEVMLGNCRHILSCSTASGPAFEGAHIKFGMRAATGAIERATINPTTLEPIYRTIESTRPRGICGSGIIDLVAEMLKVGIIDTTGKIVIADKRNRPGDRGMEYVIAFKDETANGQDDITITQQDIREVQKAKSAIHTGCSILLNKMNVLQGRINKLVMAGAFGMYIDPQNAITIGMIPEVPIDRISFAGNTAGSGARMALKSIDTRKTAERLALKMDYVELAAEPVFQEEYLNSMNLPHADYSLYPNTMKMIKAPRTSRIYRKHKPT